MTALPTIPLVHELTPAPSPWAVAGQLADLPHLLFLDSAAPLSPLSRYSFVVADPFAWLDSRTLPGDPLLALADLLAPHRLDTLPDLPPFQGGAAGLFGYDLAHHLERLPRPRFDEFQTPDLAIGLYDWVIAFDHALDRAWLLSTGMPELAPDHRHRRAKDRLNTVRRLLTRPTPTPRSHGGAAIDPAVSYPLEARRGLRSNFHKKGFLEVIRRGIEYVHAGDCFQVNLSQRLLHRADRTPFDLYGTLRACNPSPFAGYLDLGDFAIVSASPERFVRVQDGQVQTRPIKGTRPRGKTPAEDAERAQELLHSAKDRAENVMIVDLLRNDLGRVCRFGSVRPTAVCELETYPTVHHLVSEVCGTLRPGLGALDLLRASFPGGSVTGAPKIRAMEIIAELEPTARGPYCGCLGYVGFDGTADTNILIRTFTIGKGWMQFPVGGGIVADSDPAAEYAETLHKAEGLLRALR
jgi:para-aminobenzoate synthetase component I